MHVDTAVRKQSHPDDRIRRRRDSTAASHRTALQAEEKRIRRLIQTVDLTAQRLKGRKTMSDQQLFRGFTEEEQEKLDAEAAQRWDSTTVHASNARWKKYSPAKKQHILDQETPSTLT
jgi:hypothetical protein